MQFEVKIPSELINKLNELSENIDDIQNEMLDAATDVLKPEIHKNLSAATTKGYDTGELVNSIDVKKVRTKKQRANIIYFKGTVTRKFKNGNVQKVRNNLKAAVLEYGKKDQAPRPFVRPAVNAKREAMASVMEKVFDEKTKKYQ